jgi:hypothetical protein
VGRGEGSNKKVAETSCALTIVRQLFHMGVIGRANEVKKKISAEDVCLFLHRLKTKFLCCRENQKTVLFRFFGLSYTCVIY